MANDSENSFHSAEDHDDQDYDSDSSDGAPEEVGQQSARSEALKLLEAEKQAATLASDRLRAKRQAEIARNTEQKREKRARLQEKADKAALALEQDDNSEDAPMDSIPFDLLAKVAAARKGELELVNQIDENEQEENDSDSDKLPRNLSKPKRRPVTKRLSTAATEFQALSYDEIQDPIVKARLSKSDSAFNFRHRQLYGGQNKWRRSKASNLVANKQKRAVARV